MKNNTESILTRHASLDVSARAAAATARAIEAADRSGMVDIGFKRIDSPVGSLLLAATSKGLIKVAFANQDTDEVFSTMAARISPRILELPERLDGPHRQLDEYFAGKRHGFDITLDWALVKTEFQRGVLTATARIPFGSSSTYRDVATHAGNAKAVRAAGTALGANPLPVVVPCHRVLRSDGSAGGFGGGLERKAFLLELERQKTG